jgi:hypothetical protein
MQALFKLAKPLPVCVRRQMSLQQVQLALQLLLQLQQQPQLPTQLLLQRNKPDITSSSTYSSSSQVVPSPASKFKCR